MTKTNINMQLSILLVLALNHLGVQSLCVHYYDGHGWQVSTNFPNYHCVHQHQCFDNLYHLTPEQKEVTQNGRCIINGAFVLEYICCRHKSPPPTPPSRPMTESSPRPNRRQQLQPYQHNPSQFSVQIQSRPQSSTSSSTSSSLKVNCKCILRSRCHDKQITKTQFLQKGCPNTHVFCCRNLLQPSSSSSSTTFSPSPQLNPHSPSSTSPQLTTRAQLLQPSSQATSHISQHATNNNQAPQHIQPSSSPTSPHVSTRVSSLPPVIQGSSHITPQLRVVNMIALQFPSDNTFTQPLLPRPSQIVLLNADCTCTPFFSCYDEETSSNLTSIVDDRIVTKKSCESPNDICCHNLVPPASPTITNLSRQSQTQQQGHSVIAPSTSVNCDCIPRNECHDRDISSNPAGLLDGQNNNRPLRQESCPNPEHVCCHHLVHPLLPARNPLQSSPAPVNSPVFPSSAQSPSSPSQVQFPSSQGPFQPTSSPGPSQSPSTSSNCLCTPFYKCYDEETSSNLTGIVDDRAISQTGEMNTCSDQSEICCHNLVKPLKESPAESFSQDCLGSCVPIHECPKLFSMLNEAKRGNSDTIQTLRRSVCALKGELALVCCY